MGNAFERLVTCEPPSTGQSAASATRDRAATLVNRAVLYNMVGRYESACADFNAGIVINPDQGRWLSRPGRHPRMIGRFDEALVDIEQGMKHGGSMAEAAYFDLATWPRILIRGGRVRY